MTLRGTVRGRMIELDEAPPFPTGQKVSVRVEAVESGSRLGSPARLLEAVQRPPHVTSQDVADLERAIGDGKLAATDLGIFDDPATRE